MSIRLLRPLLAAACLLPCASSPSAQELPAGFVLEPVGSGWQSPVALAWIDSSRLLVAEPMIQSAEDRRAFWSMLRELGAVEEETVSDESQIESRIRQEVVQKIASGLMGLVSGNQALDMMARMRGASAGVARRITCASRASGGGRGSPPEGPRPPSRCRRGSGPRR